MVSNNRPKKSGKIIRQDPKIERKGMGPCPNCDGGRVNGKTCIACGGMGRRRQ